MATLSELGTKALTELKVDALVERRSEERIPFSRAVLVKVGDQKLSARSTDISEAGIGLEHHFKLPLGEVEILLLDKDKPRVRLRTRLTWCRAIEAGRYRSGGDFVSVTAIHEELDLRSSDVRRGTA